MLPEKQDRRLMRQLFSTVASRYDFITRAFSYGMDGRWKRAGVELAARSAPAAVLDLASGTGDFSHLARRRFPWARIVALDLTPEMLWRAARRGAGRAVCGDAVRLPFRNHVFDCVFVGYGIRNFPDICAALAEIKRVMRPGGVLVTLDFFLPENFLVQCLYLAYLHVQGAFWGAVLHGSPSVYTYIPRSLRSFVSSTQFGSLLSRSGYQVLSSQDYIWGGIGLHCAARR